MNPKLLVFALLITATQNSCSQKQNNKEQKNMITKEQYNTISKNVKTYDYNPTYQIKVNTNLCTYEIYINDMLADFSFTTGRTAGEQTIAIPQYILKSGLQSIRFKVYPKAIEDGVLEEWVDKNADFSVRIVHGEYYKMKFEDFKEVLKMKLPKIDANLPFIELKGEFIAEVPYVLEGWSKGMDLTKEDSKKLEQEVLGRIKELADLYRNKDLEGLAKEQYNRTREIDQSMYLNTKEYSQEWVNELQEALNEAKSTELLDDLTKLY